MSTTGRSNIDVENVARDPLKHQPKIFRQLARKTLGMVNKIAGRWPVRRSVVAASCLVTPSPAISID